MTTLSPRHAYISEPGKGADDDDEAIATWTHAATKTVRLSYLNTNSQPLLARSYHILKLSLQHLCDKTRLET